MNFLIRLLLPPVCHTAYEDYLSRKAFAVVRIEWLFPTGILSNEMILNNHKLANSQPDPITKCMSFKVRPDLKIFFRNIYPKNNFLRKHHHLNVFELLESGQNFFHRFRLRFFGHGTNANQHLFTS